jgi:hypothetical protein
MEPQPLGCAGGVRQFITQAKALGHPRPLFGIAGFFLGRPSFIRQYAYR